LCVLFFIHSSRVEILSHEQQPPNGRKQSVVQCLLWLASDRSSGLQLLVHCSHQGSSLYASRPPLFLFFPSFCFAVLVVRALLSKISSAKWKSFLSSAPASISTSLSSLPSSVSSRFLMFLVAS
jgi:hypothetical protein